MQQQYLRNHNRKAFYESDEDEMQQENQGNHRQKTDYFTNEDEDEIDQEYLVNYNKKADYLTNKQKEEIKTSDKAEMDEELDEVEKYTKQQLKIKKRGNIICKVVYINTIKRANLTIVTIHLLPHSKSKTATLMDIIAKKEAGQKLLKCLTLNTYYKLIKIKPYIDQTFATMNIYFDEHSLVEIMHLSPDLKKRFEINWINERRQITTNYQNERINQVPIAGYVHRIPTPIHNNLHTMTIRNQMKQIIEINFWGGQLPKVLENIQENDIIILPKVNHAKSWQGRAAINNNGPIYKENNLWPRDEPENETNKSILNLSTYKFNEAKCN